MPIHQSDGPVVKTQFEGEVTREQFLEWLNRTAALLERDEPFSVVLLNSRELTLPEGYRQMEATWFRQYKDRFAASCRGIARIAESEEQRATLDTPALHKAWPCAYKVALHEQEALEWAKSQLD